MNLTGQKIQQVNSITHDGKVIIFGTALDGKIYYAVKRSGFEDTALREGAELFGFEPWLPLPLGVSAADPSVGAREQQTLIDKDRRWLLRSVYGSSPEVLTTIDAPVQLISALGHVFVFRQAPTGKLLVNRFVLDGMTNQLQPKLEVRYARSKQRYEPQRAPGGSGAKVFDNLDYRDVDGKYFFEPAIELTFIGNVKNGWFTPLLVPTAESDRNRWHLFVQDAESEQLMLYSVGADANGNFILKDYLFGQPDPASADSILYRSIPGIIRRKIDLQRLRAAGGPSATPYDLQREQMTDTGPQLLRGVTRVMVALPVRKDGDREIKTAVLDFALAADGLLSQIDLAPDRSDMLRNDEHDVITPLSLLDDIKELAMVAPPSSGTVVATERGSEDRLQVRTREELPADVTKDGRIKIRGTRAMTASIGSSVSMGRPLKSKRAFRTTKPASGRSCRRSRAASCSMT